MTEHQTVIATVPDDVQKNLGSLDAYVILRLVEEAQIPTVQINTNPVVRNSVVESYDPLSDAMMLGLEYIATFAVASKIGDSSVPGAGVIEALCYVPVVVDTVSRIFTNRSVYSNIGRLYHRITGK